MSTDHAHSAAAPSSWDVASVLAEPHRREVYDAVRKAGTPLTRDEVAAATAINRRLTTFHLDRLAEAGLLVTDYARPVGRGGPGAGRPAKRYRSADVELELSVPPRHYVFVARLLTLAIDREPTDAVAGSLNVARAEGFRLGAARRITGRVSAKRSRAAAVAALADLGYEPSVGENQQVRLRNCPFRAVADISPDLVCGMNRELVAGVFEGMGLDGASVALGGAPGDCCVVAQLNSRNLP
jgi:predicted ArsR family transcriptional regulator